MTKKTAPESLTLADQLRQAILDSGHSINSLAKVLEIPQPVLHRFAAGERGISLKNADKIATAFGMVLTSPKALHI